MCDPCKGPLDLFAYSSPSNFNVCVQDHISCRLALAVATHSHTPSAAIRDVWHVHGRVCFFVLCFFSSEWPRLNGAWCRSNLQVTEYACWMCRNSWTGGEMQKATDSLFERFPNVTRSLATHQREGESQQTESGLLQSSTWVYSKCKCKFNLNCVTITAVRENELVREKKGSILSFATYCRQS